MYGWIPKFGKRLSVEESNLIGDLEVEIVFASRGGVNVWSYSDLVQGFSAG